MSDEIRPFNLCKDCTKRRKECKDSGSDCKWLIWCYMFESKTKIKRDKILMKQKELKAKEKDLKIKQEITERAQKLVSGQIGT